MSDPADMPSPRLSARESRVADEPFNDTTADVILRTSDKVDFYVYKNILSLASPFFKNMFSLPQSKPTSDPSVGDSAAASHPIIDVSEDARTMNFALRFCYPMRKPAMTELKDVGPVLLAACKYDMDTVFDVAKVALAQCISQDILGVFALAFRCELYDVCSKAAEQFIQHPFLSLDSKELDYIKTNGYHQLLRYHQSYSHRYLAHLSKRKNSNGSTPSPWSVPSWNPFWILPPWKYSTPSIEFTPLSSSPVTLPEPRSADVPFNDHTADIILRSSDQVDFHTHSFILSFVSPVFKDMILNHKKTQVTHSRSVAADPERPTIINVPEDFRTLDFILRRCYPTDIPRFTQLSDARRVLAAGVKYNIGAVKSYAASGLIELVDEDIIGVWAIALRYTLDDVCTVAARRTLQHPQMSLSSAELGTISARQYHELLRYHTRCGEAAAAAAGSRTWFNESMSFSDMPSRTRHCNVCYVDDPSGWHAPASFWNFLTAAKAALVARPCSLTILSDEVMGQWEFSNCSVCYRSFGRDTKFAQAFANEVDRVVAEVEVPKFF